MTRVLVTSPMSYFPDMCQRSMVASGPHVRAVGWLADGKPFTQGNVPDVARMKIREFARLSSASADALYFPAFGGFHTCEFCDQAHGIGNFGVPCGELLFVAPEMIVHYIEQHDYRPPDDFLTAVFHSPLPGTDEYDLITEPFWHLHRAALARQRAGGKLAE